ncbi:SWI6 [Candida margitis]|uniref:SWI6 n=1 Tax=Candida margitis TaxID=1775924 RepID=UPI002226FD6D|nr:SWI6 [Candida margitis]KAI5968732.1 SWI6 [Candida margitis]
MDSPANIGDSTTLSIQQKLSNTHIDGVIDTSINSAVYSGIKVIQLSIKVSEEANQIPEKSKDEIIVLRRVQDSFINISQLLDILIRLNILTQTQVKNYLNNEVLSNLEYFGNPASKDNLQVLNYANHENKFLRGIWVPYDKGVKIALKFDVYDMTKALFLVDVHDFETLPKYKKRALEGEETSNDVEQGSPFKKQKTEVEPNKNKDLVQSNETEFNPNYPYTLPSVTLEDNKIDLANDIKRVLGEVFKKDDQLDSGTATEDVGKEFESIFKSYPKEDIKDIPLDQKGQTALHFAATLASSNLIACFIELDINSPMRGNMDGESPLIACIQVTNAMEKGNFKEILTQWLHPDIWLIDKKNQTVLHHLVLQSRKNESYKFYTRKILEYVLLNGDKKLLEFKKKVLNAQDINGNTVLHLAIEKENRWFIKILADLGADTTIVNKLGIKCQDFEILNDLSDVDVGDHIFDLIKTSHDFLKERVNAIGVEHIQDVEEVKEKPPVDSESTPASSSNVSDKIFQSIHQLLGDTSLEYTKILNSKRDQIKALDQALHDATIVTANNRFQTKKLTENLERLDTFKLQAANVADKLVLSQQEVVAKDEVKFDENQHYDADEPFLIQPMYDRLANNESIADLKDDANVLRQLPPTKILQARLNAYREINSKLEDELKSLVDYSELTSKFKNVVSICTNVGIDDVDELLDGLLEAVES